MFSEAEVVGVVVVEGAVNAAEAAAAGVVFLAEAVEASEAERYAPMVKRRLLQVQSMEDIFDVCNMR